MKKIALYLAAAAVALGFSACSETWDDNPTLVTHEGVPQVDFLNTPAMADASIFLGEDSSKDHLHLTCSQPNYGYAAPATYTVEIALNEDFTTPYLPDKEPFYALATTFGDCAEINPPVLEIVEACNKMMGMQTADDVPSAYVPLYVRLRCQLKSQGGDVIEGTEYISNVVCFKNVSIGFLAICTPDLPSGIYLRGAFNDWGAPASSEFLTTDENNVWELDGISIPIDTEFKVADGEWGTINLGATSEAFAVGVPYKLQQGSNDNLLMPVEFRGSATLKLSGGTYTLIMDAAEPDEPGKQSGIFLRGDFNDWGATPEAEFITTDVKNSWVLANDVVIEAASEFKVADEGWSSVNLGGNGSPLVVGTPYKLGDIGNISCETGYVGKPTLRLKAGKYILTFP